MVAATVWLLLLLAPKCAQTTDSTSEAVGARVEQQARRVFSVGDLHGDFAQTWSILTGIGLMDGSGHWAGGHNILVQTGDVVDRGSDARKIYEALFRLQDEAPLSGGKVILLLGNHELMNMEGDFRYTTSADTEQLGGNIANRTHAFGTEGWPGKELRRRGLAVARIGRTHGFTHPVIFTHAGIQPSIAEAFASVGQHGNDGENTDPGQDVVDAINDAVHKYLSAGTTDKVQEHMMLFGDSSPFWTRHFARSPDPGRVCHDLEQSLNVVDGVRMVVGHTSQANGKINHRCGGRLVLADTQISEAYTGVPKPSAVEFGSAGEAFALYPRKHVSLKGLAFAREPLPKVEQFTANMLVDSKPQLRWWLQTLELDASHPSKLPTKSDVRKAFKRLCRHRHPDKGGTKLAFQELQLAMEGVLDVVAV
jgi:hypothetical protein